MQTPEEIAEKEFDGWFQSEAFRREVVRKAADVAREFARQMKEGCIAEALAEAERRWEELKANSTL